MSAPPSLGHEWLSGKLFMQRDFPSGLQFLYRMVPQLLRRMLANVELRADRTDRRNAMCRQLTGEYLGRLFTERIRVIRAARYAIRYHLGTADNHHEQFVRADQRHRRPRGHHRANRPVPQPVGHVGRERRRDAKAEEPPRQRRPGILRRAEWSITIELA